MKCHRCDKELKKYAWYFASPPIKCDAYCIQCAKHLSFYEQITSHGRPYKSHVLQKGESDE